MAFKGRKVADIYAELHLDRDTAKDALRGLSGALGPDADRAGRDLGKKVTEGLARAVEASSARVAKARRAEVVAADAVKLAELRLSEARDKGGQKASTLLALEQKLSQAKAKLTDANSAASTATNKLSDAQKRLAVEMANVGKNVGPAADRSGRDLGDKLSAGIEMSIVRNSPLIVAAVGAALAVGAPVALTGATALFAGIGIVAAAQSVKVRSAWTETWHQIRDGAIADSSAIEPVLVGLADRVGDGFERMRPRLRGAFEDAAPQIEVFTGGILDLAENALPGLVDAVERGMPVTEGFAAFLGKTGTGLSDFFSTLADHSPAAGAAFSGLGDIMGELLPMLGTLLGQGAELAADVLPAVSGTLGAVNTVLDHTGGLLPGIVQGLIALKIAQSVGGWVGGLSTSLGTLALQMGHTTDASGRMTGAVGKTQTVLSRMGTALPIIGAAIIGLEAAFSAADDAQDEMTTGFGEWFAAVRLGGQAAEEAREKIATLQAKLDDYDPEWGGVDVSEAFQKAADEARKYEESLTPVEAAQQRLAAATRTLEDAVDRHGAGSQETARAMDDYKAAVAENEAAQAQLEQAIHGVTSAMVEQAQQALAAANSDYAYRQSLEQIDDDLNGITEAQRLQAVAAEELATAQREHGRGSEEAAEAQRNLDAAIEATDDAIMGLEGTLLAGAEAAGRMAADASGLGEGLERDQIAASATLTELVRLREEMGDQFPPALNRAIENLQRSGAAIEGVSANSVAAADMVRGFIGDLIGLGQQQPTPTLNMDDRGFTGIYASALARAAQLAAQRPTPVAGMNNAPFASVAEWTAARIAGIGAMNVFPSATLVAYTAAAEAAINRAARARTVAITAVSRILGGGATGGKVGAVAARGFADGGSPQRRSDGKLSGPGGPLDDLIPAMMPTGEQIRVSPREWIVNAMVSGQQGDGKMALLNAGRADIVPRRSSRGSAPSMGSRSVASTASSPPSDVRTGSITIGNLNVTFSGAQLTTDRSSMRQAAVMLREEIIKLEREQS